MRRFLFIFWSLILSTSTFSQVLFEGTVNENLLKGRVKQIEEFIARFNNEEDWEGKKGNICTDTLYRKKYIRTLFDQSCYRKANGELTPLAEKFIHEVVTNNYQIHFTDSTWSAQVDCKATCRQGRKAHRNVRKREKHYEFLRRVRADKSPLRQKSGYAERRVSRH